MARPAWAETTDPGSDPEEDRWLRRNRAELALLDGDMTIPSPGGAGGGGGGGSWGGDGPPARFAPPSMGRYDPRIGGYELPPQPKSDDPFAGLKGISDLAGKIPELLDPEAKRRERERVLGRPVDDTFDPTSAAMRGMGWVGENVLDPIVGIIAKGADPTGTLQRRYEQIRGDASFADLAATARAAGGVKREFDTARQQIQEDPNAPAGDRVIAALTRGATLAADFAIDVPGAKYMGIRKAGESARLSPITDAADRAAGSGIGALERAITDREGTGVVDQRTRVYGREAPKPARSDAEASALYGEHEATIDRFAGSLAAKVTLDPDRRADLAQDAKLAAFEAARRWNDNERVSFPAYAYRRMEGAIKDSLRASDPLSRGQRAEVKAGEAQNATIDSLDRPLSAETDMTLGDIVANKVPDEAPRADVDPWKRYGHLLGQLSPNEARGLRLRFENDATFAEIGDTLGKSESGAHRLVGRAVQKMAKLIEAEAQALADRSGNVRGARAAALDAGEVGALGGPGPGGGLAALGEGRGLRGPGGVGPSAGGPRDGGVGGGRARQVDELGSGRARQLTGPERERFTVQRADDGYVIWDDADQRVVTSPIGKRDADTAAARLNIAERRALTQRPAGDTAATAAPARAVDGPTAVAAQFEALAQRYGFASADEAAQMIQRVRATTAAEGEGPRVLRMPRPVQEKILAHAEFGGRPLRDPGEVARQLADVETQLAAAEASVRASTRTPSRTRFDKNKSRKVTVRGAAFGTDQMAVRARDQLIAERDALQREKEYGDAVLDAGPTPEALADSAARAEAVHTAKNRPDDGQTALPATQAIETPLPGEAPVEAKRRGAYARGRAQGQREAVGLLRSRVNQAIDDLTKHVARSDDTTKEPSPRKVATALKALADDREAGIPRVAVGKRGATSKRNEQYRSLYERDVAPLLDVRKKLVDSLDRLREIEKSGDLEWAQLTEAEQIKTLLREHPILELGTYYDEYVRRNVEDRAEVVEAINAHIASVEAMGMPEGEVPMGNEMVFRRVGSSSKDVQQIRDQAESILMDVREYVRQAADMGVDARAVDPVQKHVVAVLERVRGLRDEINRIELPETRPEKGREPGDYVGSINLDYIANPMVRKAIGDHYLKPGNAERVEALRQRVTEEDVRSATEDLAAMLGHDSEAILAYVAEKNLPSRNEIAPYVLLMRETMAAVVTDLHDMAARGVVDERWDRALATFDGFVMELTPPVSEAARTIRFQQLIVGKPGKIATDATAALNTTGRLFDEKNAQWMEAVRSAEVAAKKALEARARAEATRNPLHARNADTLEAAAAAADAKAQQEKLALDRIEMAKFAQEARQRKARLDFLVDGLIQARKKGASPEYIKQLAALDPVTDFQAIVSLLRNLEPATKGDKLTAYVLNNMYSGLPSNEANLMGNALRLGLRLFGDPIAARLTSPLVAKLSGRPAAIVPEETAFAFAAFAHATPRALRNFLAIIKEGRGAADIAEEFPANSKFELGAPDTFPGKRGLALEGALRMLSGVDAAFFHWAYSVEYDTMLVRRAVERGAKTHDEIVNAMVDDLINPPDDLTAMAGQIGADLTYRKALDKFTQGVVDFASKRYNIPGLGETPLLKWVLTPIMFTANAAKYAVSASGGGMVTLPVQTFRTGRALKALEITPQQAVMMDRQAARAGLLGVAGALMVADAIMAYAQGDLTGDGPTDFEKRRIWEGTHKRRSIRRGDGGWQSYEQGWPLNAAYWFVSNIGDAVSEGRISEDDAFGLTLRGIGAIADTLLDQPFLRNTATWYEFIDTLRRGRSAESFSAQQMRKAIPWSSAQRDLAEMVDPYERDPETFIEQLEARLPMFRKSIRTELTRWGDPRPNVPTGMDVLAPWAAHTFPDDPVEKEVGRLEAIRVDGDPLLSTIGFVSDKVGKVDLDPDERHFYQAEAGQRAHKAIGELIRLPTYGQWTDGKKADEVRKAAERARKEAREALANRLLGAATTPDGTPTMVDTGAESRMKGLRIGLSEAKGAYRRTKLMESWVEAITGDPKLVEAFDRYKGDDDLSLYQYRQLVPLVKWYEAQPEFANEQGKPIGNEAQWTQYHKERREWTKIRRDRGAVAATVYYETHPILKVYEILSNRAGGKNPQVTAVKRVNPLLNRITLPREEDPDR